MPTVPRLRGLRAVIYPNDHRPAHVHVIGKRHEAVFELNGPNGTVALRENYGFPQRELAAVARGLLENRAQLISEWERIHGEA